MKKKIIIAVSVITAFLMISVLGLVLTIGLYGFHFRIDENNELCEKAVAYFNKNNPDEHYQNEEDYQRFTKCRAFALYSNTNYTYVFLWIKEESYYTKNGRLYCGSGSNIPYKFVFRDGKVVNYEIPMDGEHYAQSIRKWFPKPVRFLSRLFMEYGCQSGNDFEEQINRHYSYLESTKIHFDTD